MTRAGRDGEEGRARRVGMRVSAACSVEGPRNVTVPSKPASGRPGARGDPLPRPLVPSSDTEAPKHPWAAGEARGRGEEGAGSRRGHARASDLSGVCSHLGVNPPSQAGVALGRGGARAGCGESRGGCSGVRRTSPWSKAQLGDHSQRHCAGSLTVAESGSSPSHGRREGSTRRDRCVQGQHGGRPAP